MGVETRDRDVVLAEFADVEYERHDHTKICREKQIRNMQPKIQSQGREAAPFVFLCAKVGWCRMLKMWKRVRHVNLVPCQIRIVLPIIRRLNKEKERGFVSCPIV